MTYNLSMFSFEVKCFLKVYLKYYLLPLPNKKTLISFISKKYPVLFQINIEIAFRLGADKDL